MEIHSDIQKHQSQPNSPLFFISVLDQFGDDGQPILEVAMDQATPTPLVISLQSPTVPTGHKERESSQKNS